MKILIAFLSLVSISTTAFAVNTCDQAALDVAKMNLDTRAKAYAFDESYITTTSLKKMSATKDGATSYTVSGFIYKGSYNIQLSLDSSCGLESLTIKDSSQ